VERARLELACRRKRLAELDYQEVTMSRRRDNVPWEDLKFRQGTMTGWRQHNPVLAHGEIAVCKAESGELIDVREGDGVTPWKDLPLSDLEDFGRRIAVHGLRWGWEHLRAIIQINDN
jgi:ribosome modulation factor